MSGKVTLNLNENARSFLIESLKYALSAEKEPLKWKYAILHLIQSVELTLKESLRQEHFSLVFVDPGRMDNTVTIDQAIKRLKKVSDIEFTKEELELLNCARQWRNQIIHFEFEFNEENVKSIYSALLAFLAYYHSIHGESSMEWEVDKELWEATKPLFKKREKMINLAKAKLRKLNLSETDLWTCRHCGNKYLSPSERVCYACGHSEEIQRCENCNRYTLLDDLNFVFSEHDRMYHLCAVCEPTFNPSGFGTFHHQKD